MNMEHSVDWIDLIQVVVAAVLGWFVRSRKKT